MLVHDANCSLCSKEADCRCAAVWDDHDMFGLQQTRKKNFRFLLKREHISEQINYNEIAFRSYMIFAGFCDSTSELQECTFLIDLRIQEIRNKLVVENKAIYGLKLLLIALTISNIL